MVSSSLRFNGYQWRVDLLGEETILLWLPDKLPEAWEAIRSSSRRIQSLCGDRLQDMVPAYDSIALFFPLETVLPVAIIELLAAHPEGAAEEENEVRTYRIPVCYEKGLDWEDLEKHTGLAMPEIIRIHSAQQYRVAMIGFLPGFTYLSGMDPAIGCPRKANPRVRVPAGSIGIGGEQTGIYSFACPGGWQIIGQAPMTLFHMNDVPFSLLDVGDLVNFKPIDTVTYDMLLQKEKKSGE